LPAIPKRRRPRNYVKQYKRKREEEERKTGRKREREREREGWRTQRAAA